MGASGTLGRLARGRRHKRGDHPLAQRFCRRKRRSGPLGQPIFIDFTAKWCGPCQSLKTTTWADPKVAAALAGYVPLRIDIDAQPAAASEYQINSIPAFFVLDAHDHHVIKQDVGAKPPQKFLDWLKQ